MVTVVFIYVFAMLMRFGMCYNCEEKKDVETINYPHGKQKIINHRYTYIYSEDIIRKVTIECSKIYSLGGISYNYLDQEYEQSLKIVNSNISSINSLELFNFKTIVKLYLNNSHVKTVMPGAFTGLRKLEELYLNDNQLTEILNSVYNSLKTLKLLDLTNNKISKIDPLGFVGLSSLHSFYFSKNNLTIINIDFGINSKLDVLDLSQNPLEIFSVTDTNWTINNLFLSKTFLEKNNDFSSITCKFVYLTNCGLTQVNFEYLPKSERIDLSDNKITLIENCENINYFNLNLRNNKIKKIDDVFGKIEEIYLSYNQLEVLEIKFLKPESVTIVDLSHNLLTNLSNDFFCNFTSLRNLQLNDNNLSYFPPDIFKDLTQLTNLDLSNNKYKQFPYGLFDNLKNLKVLNISNNQFLSLQQLTFHSLINLEELYFDFNQISVIDVNNLMQHVPRLQIISLNYNPWNCENLIEIYNSLKIKNVKILVGQSYSVENFYGIACKNSKVDKLLKNTSDLSYQEVADKMQEAINEGIENSNLDFLFNKNFEQSKFVQFFDKDYQQSNLFKYLNNLKFSLTFEDNLNKTQSGRITALETVSEKSSNLFLIFIIVLLFAITCTLLALLYLFLKFINFSTTNRKIETISEMELC